MELPSEPLATVWTIGHSTRTWDAFLGLLREHGIELLADVRHFPSSERVPWTNGPALAEALRASDLEYVHIVDLGGYRKPRPDSANKAWRSSGFRGYADHMATPEFEAALERLLSLAAERRLAVMCAEAVPWRCHRSLLSDALGARGTQVVHILAPGKSQGHRLTTFAKVRADRVTYPASKAKTHKRRRP